MISWPGGKTEEKYCIEPGTYSGIILVYASRNGEPLAIIQDGYLQHLRVGGSAGLGADIVVSATDAMGPTFDAAWVADGAHVTCVTRRELSAALVERADVTVQLGIATIPPGSDVPGIEWRRGSMAAYIAGRPEERERIPRGRAEEQGAYSLLVDVTSGRARGRTSDDQVTLLVNTGTQGLQFAAVAGRAHALAREAGVGQHLPTELFLQDIRD